MKFVQSSLKKRVSSERKLLRKNVKFRKKKYFRTLQTFLPNFAFFARMHFAKGSKIDAEYATISQKKITKCPKKANN